jgi:hypothetical protein
METAPPVAVMKAPSTADTSTDDASVTVLLTIRARVVFAIVFFEYETAPPSEMPKLLPAATAPLSETDSASMTLVAFASTST